MFDTLLRGVRMSLSQSPGCGLSLVRSDVIHSNVSGGMDARGPISGSGISHRGLQQETAASARCDQALGGRRSEIGDGSS
jgi:hypothetical protein